MELSPHDILQGWFEKLASRTELGEADRAAILALPGEPVQVECNRDFVGLGERPGYASLVVDGLIGRFCQNGEGQRQIIAVHIPGDMADLHSMVAPDASSALQALSVTTILRVPHHALRDAARRHPGIAEAFWRECVVDASVMAEWVVNVGRRDARTRTAHLMCEMACRYEAAGQDVGFSFPFPVTQTHLADMLALTPVHVNRILKVLREDVLAQVHGRTVQILDWDGIMEAGEFDSAYLQIARKADGEARVVELARPLKSVGKGEARDGPFVAVPDRASRSGEAPALMEGTR